MENVDKYDELINRLMESGKIQTTYDNYIIKDITLKEWIVGMVDQLLTKERHCRIERVGHP